MNSAIQLKLFSSGGSTPLLGEGRGGGGLPDPEICRRGGWSQKNLFFLAPVWSKNKKGPSAPLDPPLLSKAPIVQGMDDDAGIEKKKKQSTFS